MQCKNMHNLFFQKKKTCITYWDLFYLSAIEVGLDSYAGGQCLKSKYQATAFGYEWYERDKRNDVRDQYMSPFKILCCCHFCK